MIMERTCKKCGETKPIEEFYLQPGNKNGYNSECKSCKKIYKADYYRKNIKLIKSKHRIYSQSHKQEKIDYRREWLKNNPEKAKLMSKKSHERNRENILAYLRIYQKTHKNKLNEKSKLWARNHPNKEKIKHQRYVKSLCDGYIIEQLFRNTGLLKSKIKEHPELIEVKRIQIKLKRLANENSNRT
jgi:hypothetical protein